MSGFSLPKYSCISVTILNSKSIFLSFLVNSKFLKSIYNSFSVITSLLVYKCTCNFNFFAVFTQKSTSSFFNNFL